MSPVKHKGYIRANTGAEEEKRADGQSGLGPHSATDSARVRIFAGSGKDDGGTTDASTFLTCNIEGLSINYRPFVISYVSGFDFILLTETSATCFPVVLFPSHDVYVSPGVRLTDTNTARLSGGVDLLVGIKRNSCVTHVHV